MSNCAGVWIDHQQAIVVQVTEAGGQIKKLKSDFAKPPRPDGNSTARPRLSRKDFVAEDRIDRRLAEQYKRFYEQVLVDIGKVDALLIMGPGEAKVEFSKFCQAKKVAGVVERMEALGKVTDRQLVAHVVEFYDLNPIPSVAARKKSSAVRRAPKATKPAPAKKPVRKKGRQ